ncbi:uncharacterized protein PRCAT00005463001 [Priceomyces carsonii]|uniref:uncharacterized protein n=1 Tax=Priceomyces carsonii TaxID=28549 RepID=UPI002ED84888|nr:unnamed protein product [Priceomyces carsonii]
MTVGATYKVLLLPNDKCEQATYKIVHLPTDSTLKRYRPFLIKDSTIYELIEVKGNDAFSKTKPTLLNNGEAVKSYIFEDDTNGLVIQSSNMIVGNSFNIVYLLISVMFDYEGFLKRYITFEDIMDTLSSLSGNNTDWVTRIPEEAYLRALPEICDTILENKEQFYRFSKQKTLQFINEKVQKLHHFIQMQENSIMFKIKAELHDDASSTPEAVINSSILRHSIDLICDSYCPKIIKVELIELFAYDFKDLDSYLDELKAKRKEVSVIESSMAAIAQGNSQVAKKKADATKKKPTTKKKATKVAVGKGALDGFFKKA